MYKCCYGMHYAQFYIWFIFMLFFPNFFMQIVSRLVQIRDYITKASSMREDLVEKNERSANVERLTHLIDHLKEQEKSYMKFLQKILVSFGPFQ